MRKDLKIRFVRVRNQDIAQHTKTCQAKEQLKLNTRSQSKTMTLSTEPKTGPVRSPADRIFRFDAKKA
jgi:hypothetical protein